MSFFSDNVESKDDSSFYKNANFYKIYPLFKEGIIKTMSRNCWIENKDYFFGTTKLNCYPTIYYKKSSSSDIKSYLRGAIRDTFYSISDYSRKDYNLAKAFNIDIDFFVIPEIYFGCNLLEENALQEAVNNDNERWKFYLNHKSDIQESMELDLF